MSSTSVGVNPSIVTDCAFAPVRSVIRKRPRSPESLWKLRLTPDERVRQLDAFLESVKAIQRSTGMVTTT